MTTTYTPTQRDIDQRDLIISLLKDGAEWQGDIFSRTYLELLIVPQACEQEAIQRTLSVYTEGIDYKVERDPEGRVASVWINE